MSMTFQDFKDACEKANIPAVRAFVKQQRISPLDLTIYGMGRRILASTETVITNLLRRAYFIHSGKNPDLPEMAEEFERYNPDLREENDDFDTVSRFMKDHSSVDNKTIETILDRIYLYFSFLERAPAFLFDHSLPRRKEDALKWAAAQMYLLLDSPKSCLFLISKIEQRLQDYFKETYKTDFPTFDTPVPLQSYYPGLLYPVPPIDFKPVKTHHALAIILSRILKKHGLAQEIFKWNGYIPQRIADKMIEGGGIAVEGSHFSTMTHGKYAHMFQQALVALAKEEGFISCDYINAQGVRETLSIRDIYTFVVKASLWEKIFDAYELFENSFRDPNQLTAYLMQQASALGTTFTNIFCKYFIRNFTFYTGHPDKKDIFNDDPVAESLSQCTTLEEFAHQMSKEPYISVLLSEETIYYMRDSFNKKPGRWSLHSESEEYFALKRSEPYEVAVPPQKTKTGKERRHVTPSKPYALSLRSSAPH